MICWVFFWLLLPTTPARVQLLYPLRDARARVDPPDAVWLKRVRKLKRDLAINHPKPDVPARGIAPSAVETELRPLPAKPNVPGDIVYWQIVEPDGRVRTVFVIASNQDPLVDRYFAHRFESWRWIPAQRDGKPVSSVVTAGGIEFQAPESTQMKLETAYDEFWHRYSPGTDAIVIGALGILIGVILPLRLALRKRAINARHTQNPGA